MPFQKIKPPRRKGIRNRKPRFTPIQRLMAKVGTQGKGCWDWIGSKNVRGYAQLYDYEADRPIIASRVSYKAFIGPIPNGLVVRHKCDNPACVNPFHLELGTHADNTRDKVERGRVLRGDKCPYAKLTDAEVAEIRATYIPRHPEFGGRALGAKFNVCFPHISQIISNKKRKTVKGD